jgi:hypothetical protein
MADPFRKTYRELDDLEKTSVERIKSTAFELWQILEDRPNSRELSLAKTKLEEAVMWAVKAITG